MFNKSILLIPSMGVLIGALAFGGCSSTSNTTTPSGDDSGTAGDATAHHDGAADASPNKDTGTTGDAAKACAPGDVSSFTAPAYKPAKRVAGACTMQQISDFYTKCDDNATATSAMCNAFVASAGACAACIEGKVSDATWAATVVRTGYVEVNVAGCMELLGGTAGADCANKAQASGACNDAACAPTCPVKDDASLQLYSACAQQAAGGGCSTFTQARQTCQQALSGGDGGASVCLSGMDFASFYAAVVPVFCGP